MRFVRDNIVVKGKYVAKSHVVFKLLSKLFNYNLHMVKDVYDYLYRPEILQGIKMSGMITPMDVFDPTYLLGGQKLTLKLQELLRIKYFYFTGQLASVGLSLLSDNCYKFVFWNSRYISTAFSSGTYINTPDIIFETMSNGDWKSRDYSTIDTPFAWSTCIDLTEWGVKGFHYIF